jgi:hypothetical protein
MNIGLRMRGRAFRLFMHKGDQVDRQARDAGLEPARRDKTLLWQVVVYRRTAHAR